LEQQLQEMQAIEEQHQNLEGEGQTEDVVMQQGKEDSSTENITMVEGIMEENNAALAEAVLEEDSVYSSCVENSESEEEKDLSRKNLVKKVTVTKEATVGRKRSVEAKTTNTVASKKAKTKNSEDKEATDKGDGKGTGTSTGTRTRTTKKVQSTKKYIQMKYKF
jgi:hypothetical protein